MNTNSLRLRIIITTVIVVTLTSSIFGTVIFLIKQRLEEATFGRMVKHQLQTILTEPEAAMALQNPLLKDWHFYAGNDVATLPVALRALTPGTYHSIRLMDTYWHVEVDSQNGSPVYLVYDVTEWEEQEHALLESLAYGLIIVLLAGIAMGSQATRAILVPIRRLTNRVAAIQPGQRQVRIASEFSGSEIGQIADALDGYLARIDQFVEREQTFSAAASHELRTPLSVIMGAVDILDANPQTAMATRAIGRIKRACTDMHAFIEATLFLSREGSTSISQEPQADLADIIRDLVQDSKSLLEKLSIQLETHIGNHLIVQQPRSILQITVGNILRNAIEHSAGNTIVVAVEGRTLTITDTGEGIPANSLSAIFDASYTTKPGGTGLGLNLVKRVCDRLHWHLTVTSVHGEGTRVAITFP